MKNSFESGISQIFLINLLKGRTKIIIYFKLKRSNVNFRTIFFRYARENGRKCQKRRDSSSNCSSVAESSKSKMHFYWKIGKLDSAPHRFRFVTKIFPLSFIPVFFVCWLLKKPNEKNCICSRVFTAFWPSSRTPES